MSKVHPTRPLGHDLGRRRAFRGGLWVALLAGCFHGGYNVLDSCDLETPVLCASLRGTDGLQGRVVSPSRDIVPVRCSGLPSVSWEPRPGRRRHRRARRLSSKMRSRRVPASRTEM
jgi:hypothetical protein